MGAGEQRLFFILQELFRSPKYGLILIDEIDLLLHGDALEKFLKIAIARARVKNLQVVFTSHRESILDFESFINIRHIHNTTVKTFCFAETKPDAMRRLTGKPQRPLEVFVEDALAATIVNKVAAEMKIRKYVAATCYGAAINVFTILAGIFLKGDSIANALFVLDGDVYTTNDEKSTRINAVLTGTDAAAVQHRNEALTHLRQFTLPEGNRPEPFINGMICGIQEDDLDPEEQEIADLAKEVHATGDSHHFIGHIVIQLGCERQEGLTKAVDLAAKAAGWADYVAPVREWLEVKKPIVLEAETQQTVLAGGTA